MPGPHRPTRPVPEAPMSSSHGRSPRAAPRRARRADPQDPREPPDRREPRERRGPREPPQRDYGAWYPLVRVGHFLLMALTSCLIIMVGLGLLAIVVYLFLTLTK